MPLSAAELTSFPNITRIYEIALDALTNTNTRFGLECWQSLCQGRAFPARGDIEPRTVLPIMKSVVIVRVVDGGNDFEHRIVGDAVVMAYNATLIGRRISDIFMDAPLIAERFRDCFTQVANTKRPMAVRGVAGHDNSEMKFTEVEIVLLPLGEGDDVDHIMTVSAFQYA